MKVLFSAVAVGNELIQTLIVVRGRGGSNADAREERDQPAVYSACRRALRSGTGRVRSNETSDTGSSALRAALLFVMAASYHSAAVYIGAAEDFCTEGEVVL
jgi:hypothetical protein